MQNNGTNVADVLCRVQNTEKTSLTFYVRRKKLKTERVTNHSRISTPAKRKLHYCVFMEFSNNKIRCIVFQNIEPNTSFWNKFMNSTCRFVRRSQSWEVRFEQHSIIITSFSGTCRKHTINHV